jgi:outer membrane protein assembly factor BamB
VHSVVVSNDDLVYVADRTNNRFQVFRLDGTFVKEVFIARNTLQAEGTVHHFVLSPDKAQQFLYSSTDRTRSCAFSIARRWRSWPTSADTPDTMRASSSTSTALAVDSKGNLYLGEVNNGQRYYRYAFKGMGPAGR